MRQPTIIRLFGLILECLFFLQSVQAQTNTLRFRTFMGAEDGRIYAITYEGNLSFYWHLSQDGTPVWTNSGVGVQIGSGWEAYPQVCYNGDGIIYAVGTNGILYYFRDLARDGTKSWANGGVGVPVATNWGNYKWILGGGDGIIYTCQTNGLLFFFRNSSTNEVPAWDHGGVGQLIGSSWDAFDWVAAGTNGVFYAKMPTGALRYYRDSARNGTANWQSGSGLLLKSGWTPYVRGFSTGSDTLYAVDNVGTMDFYRVSVTGTNVTWDYSGVAQPIGSGFLIGKLEGYCWPLSAPPGGLMDFMISGFGRTDITFCRHKATSAGVIDIPVGGTNLFAWWQPILTNSGQVACGWTNAFTLQIPPDWVSGIYSAHCANDLGDSFSITFVVNPAPQSHSAMVVLTHINTWNAYNSWGGGSKYTGRAHLTFHRPNPGASPRGTPHLTRGDLWILGWLEDEGLHPDVYTDLDFHNGLVLGGYKCLVLNTHPEYWSLQMYTNLQTYLATGGSVLSLGGDAICENAEYTADQTGMIYLGGVDNGSGVLFRNMNPPKPERALLGVGYEPLLARQFAPFQVLQAAHPFFQGTGLTNGQTFGATGLNGGGASGWEVDTVGPGTPPGTIRIAEGTNSSGSIRGGDMVYYAHPAGGIVFSVGSISFGGSLVIDTRLQQILRNAIAEAFAEPARLKAGLGPSASLQLSLRGRYGANYQVQQSANLNAALWVDTGLLRGDGTVSTVLLPMTNECQLYRAFLRP